MTREEAIEAIKCNWPDSRYTILREALDMAISALREQDAADKDVGKNEPLTPYALREMDGEPVWVEFQDGSGGCWGLVHITVFTHIVFANGHFARLVSLTTARPGWPTARSRRRGLTDETCICQLRAEQAQLLP